MAQNPAETGPHSPEPTSAPGPEQRPTSGAPAPFPGATPSAHKKSHGWGRWGVIAIAGSLFLAALVIVADVMDVRSWWRETFSGEKPVTANLGFVLANSGSPEIPLSRIDALQPGDKVKLIPASTPGAHQYLLFVDGEGRADLRAAAEFRAGNDSPYWFYDINDQNKAPVGTFLLLAARKPLNGAGRYIIDEITKQKLRADSLIVTESDGTQRASALFWSASGSEPIVHGERQIGAPPEKRWADKLLAILNAESVKKQVGPLAISGYSLPIKPRSATSMPAGGAPP